MPFSMRFDEEYPFLNKLYAVIHGFRFHRMGGSPPAQVTLPILSGASPRGGGGGGAQQVPALSSSKVGSVPSSGLFNVQDIISFVKYLSVHWN